MKERARGIGDGPDEGVLLLPLGDLTVLHLGQNAPFLDAPSQHSDSGALQRSNNCNMALNIQTDCLRVGSLPSEFHLCILAQNFILLFVSLLRWEWNPGVASVLGKGSDSKPHLQPSRQEFQWTSMYTVSAMGVLYNSKPVN